MLHIFHSYEDVTKSCKINAYAWHFNTSFQQEAILIVPHLAPTMIWDLGSAVSFKGLRHLSLHCKTSKGY